MALTENISPPGPEVAFGSPLSTFVCCGMEEGGVRRVFAAGQNNMHTYHCCLPHKISTVILVVLGLVGVPQRPLPLAAAGGRSTAALAPVVGAAPILTHLPHTAIGRALVDGQRGAGDGRALATALTTASQEASTGVVVTNNVTTSKGTATNAVVDCRTAYNC